MRALVLAFFVAQCLAFNFDLSALFKTRNANHNGMMSRAEVTLAGTAFLRETSQVGHLIMGIVDFYYKKDDSDKNVWVSTYIYSQAEYLRKGSEYGITIGEYGDVTERQGNMIGGHWEGTGSTIHGCPPSATRHAGDLGNFLCGSTGLISDTRELNMLGFFKDDPRGSIIGRAVALHGTPDQCAGEYIGPYIAIGTIGIGYAASPSVGLDFEPNLLVARLTGTIYCFICQGTAWIWKDTDNNVIRVRIRAFVEYSTNQSVHGFVINQYGDLTTKNGLNAGDHYDTTNSPHNLPPLNPRHQGDLGNNQYRMPYTGGQYIQIWLDKTFDINTFTFQELAGRAISFYEVADKGSLCDNGGFGNPLGQGVLGIGSPDVIVPNVPGKAYTVSASSIDRECVDTLSLSSSVANVAAHIGLLFVVLLGLLF